MEDKIKELLRNIGVSKTYTGYRYLLDTLMLVSEDPGRLENMKENILLPISIKYEVSVNSVGNCLYTVRDVIVRRSRACYPELIPEKLSLKELIQNLCTHLRAEE